MALGISRAGFRHEAIVECDPSACETIRVNKNGTSNLASDWPLVEADIRTFNYAVFRGNIDLVAGGPPCQPFSQGGKGRGHADPRNMFPEAIRAVRESWPRTFLFENVTGLLRWSFAEYVDYLRLCFAYPDLHEKKCEPWHEHYQRLEQHHITGASDCYRVVVRCLNAADYGVPQHRERVIVVGVRSDLGLNWQFPIPTHSEQELLRAQWISGEYWEIHRIPKKLRPKAPREFAERIESIRGNGVSTKRWQTVRDAIGDLPPPTVGKNGGVLNHEYLAGARRYAGHTGSQQDWPAKALKAGGHGVPGGENMLAYRNGKVRYFTVRECARLQTFPDKYIFAGSWGAIARQLGNAMPVRLADMLASSLKDALRKRLGRSVKS